MFGVVPRKIWEKRYPSVADMCPMGMNILLLEIGNRKILIDTGVGIKSLRKLKSYGFHGLKSLEEEVLARGISPNDITDVVLTHLHFDHCGGCTVAGKDDVLEIAFPNATHWVSRLQWNHFQSERKLDRDAYLAENIVPLHEAGLLHFIEEDTELFDGFRLCLYNGHTPGQIVPVFSVNDQVFCFAGDVVPTVAHLSPLWISPYDLYPVDSVNEKIRLLDQVVLGNWILVTYHDIYHPMVAVKKMGGFYKIKHIYTSEV